MEPSLRAGLGRTWHGWAAQGFSTSPHAPPHTHTALHSLRADRGLRRTLSPSWSGPTSNTCGNALGLAGFGSWPACILGVFCCSQLQIPFCAASPHGAGGLNPGRP